MAGHGAHPKPIAQVLFIVSNTILFLVGVALFVLFMYIVSSKIAASVLITVFAIISVILIILPILGCIGSRFGPKGKEAHLSCLVIYYFILFILLIAIFIISMFFFYSDNFVKQTISTFGQELANSLAAWLINVGGVAEVLNVFTGNPVVVTVMIVLLSIVLLLCLILCAYIIGYELFVKVNLSFGSLFILAAGVAILVMSIIFKDFLNIGGDFSFFGWILLGVGIVIIVLGSSGCVCGMMPRKCNIGLHLYALILIIVLGVFAVFGVVILFFPAMFWQSLVDSISDACLSKENIGVADQCHKTMDEYFEATCYGYGATIADAPSKGPCSVVDIVDRVANNILNGMMSYLQTVAFAGLVIAIVFLYVVLIVLIALNSTWETQGVKKVDLLMAKQKTH
ncbi:uncharacterized protein MONOS_15365 [Monocercomonoides exilis]|uniref:uncharacterized protein n=1 Tax=Monocercomonoides exilis TaxID=2049356 RepID=UPI00355A8A79|nr:hypothetical protein MONOS_15365 [Monocercomonoides exilis]|eukprot:MONOS_15365.1-p1 / transcript=MONOS_15365.1 / gene=MONOS_15365 / organism=Monocercomonoides_exilis_PA203 / gene_product=unspecified product / transcript_product=unspecified product / location=Mono_scaffold01210:989-2499(-) / protein_length=396 / sequence_SO=supercontig / SO=protein_coding / is_pseudo=false